MAGKFRLSVFSGRGGVWEGSERALAMSTDFHWWLDFCTQIFGDPVEMQLTIGPKNQKAIPVH